MDTKTLDYIKEAGNGTPMLTQHIADFLTSCRAAGLAPKTLTWYAGNLRIWSEWIGARDWQDVATTREFLAFQQSRKERYTQHPKRQQIKGGVSPLTVRGYLRTLKRFFGWLVEEDRLTSNPLERVHFSKKTKRVPRAIQAIDFDKLMSAAHSVRDRALLLVLRDTGCRAGEVCGLRVKDVDFETRRIKVRGKGDKERFAFLNSPTCLMLKSWLSRREYTPDDFLFVSRYGPFQPTTIDNLLRRLAKRCDGIGRHNPHAFRHAFARDWLLSGGDLASLSDVLGHNDIETTKIYSFFQTEELQKMHAQHSPVKLFKVGAVREYLKDRQRFATVKRAAKLLKLSPSMIYKLVDDHKLTPQHEPIGPAGEIVICFNAEQIAALKKTRQGGDS